MYASKKNNITIWDNNHSPYHSEKTQLPPPPPVPPHRTPPPPQKTTIHLSSSSSQLMRCTSLPHAAKPTITISNHHTITTNSSVPARPMSWHPIPSRHASRFCQNDPEIKAKLDRIAQSDRLLSLRKIMHS